MNIRYRAAAVADAGVIAPMNAQLIRDEGHRNEMTVPQLAERMADWLKGDYHASRAAGDTVVHCGAGGMPIK
jgi:hypothetical protein